MYIIRDIFGFPGDFPQMFLTLSRLLICISCASLPGHTCYYLLNLYIYFIKVISEHTELEESAINRLRFVCVFLFYIFAPPRELCERVCVIGLSLKLFVSLLQEHFRVAFIS